MNPTREQPMTEPNPTASPADSPDGPSVPAPDKGFPDNTPVVEMSAEQQIAYWMHKARKHEDRVKALNPNEIEQLRTKAAEFDKLTDAQKSEVEKARERAEAAERKAAEIETRAIRAEVAAAKGVPVELLAGTTKEEMEAAADKLLAFRGQKPPADFGGGDRGSDVGGGAKKWTQADLAGKSSDEINAARKAGHLDRLMGKTT